ncbi:hypothetical protein D3C72_2339750 [compost metagenome]
MTSRVKASQAAPLGFAQNSFKVQDHAGIKQSNLIGHDLARPYREKGSKVTEAPASASKEVYTCTLTVEYLPKYIYEMHIIDF